MKNPNKLSRRKFILDSSKAAALVGTASLLYPCTSCAGSKKNNWKIPRRKLGNTGLDVSILAFGGGSQFLQNNDGEWEKLIETALEGGINFFETAPSYIASKFWKCGDGKSLDSSEQRFGHVLSPHRKKIVLSTKLSSRDPELAKESLETSLKNFRTDYVDLLMIHGITAEDQISVIEKGLFKTMQSFKESGMVKNIGFSCMNDPEHGRDMLDKLDFDVVLATMNATKYGGFANAILPVARKKNVGAIAMKVMRDIVGVAATPRELLSYAWTQPGVSAATVGHWGMEALMENIQIAQQYVDEPMAWQNQEGEKTLQYTDKTIAHLDQKGPMTMGYTSPVAERYKAELLSHQDREELELRLASYAEPHALCWTRPGYRDGDIVVS